MDNQSRSAIAGLGTLLTIVFLILKIVGVFDWSWWWVPAPFIIGNILAFIRGK